MSLRIVWEGPAQILKPKVQSKWNKEVVNKPVEDDEDMDEENKEPGQQREKEKEPTAEERMGACPRNPIPRACVGSTYFRGSLQQGTLRSTVALTRL